MNFPGTGFGDMEGCLPLLQGGINCQASLHQIGGLEASILKLPNIAIPREVDPGLLCFHVAGLTAVSCRALGPLSLQASERQTSCPIPSGGQDEQKSPKMGVSNESTPTVSVFHVIIFFLRGSLTCQKIAEGIFPWVGYLQ